MKSLLGNRKVLIVLGLALLAAVGGWYLSGSFSDPAPQAKLPVEPIEMAEPFIVNLRGDGSHFIKLGVAVRLAPMTAEEHGLFESGGEGGGGHGASDPEAGGPHKVAHNNDLENAVVAATRRFSREELLAANGMDRLEEAILAEMQQRMNALHPDVPKGADKPPHNPAHAPWEIDEVIVTQMPVQ